MVAAPAAAVAASPTPIEATTLEPAVRVVVGVVAMVVMVPSGGPRAGSVPASHQGYERAPPRSTTPPEILGTFFRQCRPIIATPRI
ncbi:hypothetical protein Aau02nite_58460 [Amorphoplanes auranticolor]|uniref:Uncharacterized protein n=1 Tax=Actinoplanes auranticolor TaxID=47988 RepID=A0A919SLR8_9ACTN|nr:hypothetical protein Aau02nite_58460 [Actinoplanes auranticolor]